MKKVLKIVLGAIVLGYVLVMLIYGACKRNNQVCRSLHVIIEDSAEIKFVNSREIKQYVLRHFKGIQGCNFSDINLEKVEEWVNKFPAVASSDVYPSLDGKLQIVIQQREPVLRVFEQGTSYLLDTAGMKIPLRGSYSRKLMVITGNLKALKSRKDLVVLNDFIQDDSFWRAQVEQINVNNQGDMILVPRVGNHRINIGGVNDLEYKFRNLFALYEHGLDPLEWNSYREISVKYKGQVICSKL
jgi:cell division protein FtsQ